MNESNSVWGLVPLPISTNGTHAVFLGNFTTLEQTYARAIYAHLRSLTENNKKAAKIVRLVKGDNGIIRRRVRERR